MSTQIIKETAKEEGRAATFRSVFAVTQQSLGLSRDLGIGEPNEL